LRPGRFDRLLEIPLPDNNSRKEILKIHTAKKPLDSTVNLDRLVELTKGYSGADIAALVNAAAMSAIKDYVAVNRSEAFKSNSESEKREIKKHEIPLSISFSNFEAALKKIKRNVRIQNSGLT
jgi:transitional endoplasmic reticulum ATPase